MNSSSKVFCFTVSLLITFSSFHTGNAQTEFHRKTIRKLNPIFYLKNSVFRDLEMSGDQIEVAEKLRDDCHNWFQSGEFRSLVRLNDKSPLQSKYALYFDQLGEHLNEAQKRQLNLFVAAKYHQVVANVQLVNKMKFKPDQFTTQPWFSKEFCSDINFSKQQSDSLINLLEGQSAKYEIERKNSKTEIKNLFNQWQQELQSKLSKKQLLKYKRTLGQKIPFSETDQKYFQAVCPSRCLPLSIDTPYYEEGAETLQSEAQYLRLIVSRFDSSFELHYLFDFLTRNYASDFLDLSSKQEAKLASIKKTWLANQPKLRRIKYRNSFGLIKPDLNQFKKKTESEKTVKKILNELSSPQKVRLRQFWNRVVIQLGWKKVPLSHPDWARQLSLDPKTRQAFKKICLDYKKKYYRLQNERDERIKNIKYRFDDSARSILTAEQSNKVTELFGHFGNGENIHQ